MENIVDKQLKNKNNVMQANYEYEIKKMNKQANDIGLYDMIEEYEENGKRIRKPMHLEIFKQRKDHLKEIYDQQLKRINDAIYLPREASLKAIKYVVSNIDEKNYELFVARIKLKEGVYDQIIGYNLVFLCEPTKLKEAMKNIIEKNDIEKDPYSVISSSSDKDDFIALAYYKDIDEDRIYYSCDEPKYVTESSVNSECATYDINHDYIYDFASLMIIECLENSSGNYTINIDDMMKLARNFVNNYRKNETQKLTFESDENN